MSFSSQIKEEISKMNTFKNKKLIQYEFIGYLMMDNVNVVKNKIKFSTENEYNINRFHKLLNTLEIDYHIELQGRNYVITCLKEKVLEFVTIEDKKIKILSQKLEELQKEEEVKAFIRGCFLGGGSMNDPNKKYHTEMIFSSKENAELVKNILKNYEIKLKELQRKSGYSLYLKEGEEISRFLALIGASTAMLKFEEIRVLKETRNHVNRMVNCETANLNKTIHAAVKQIEAIKKIKKAKKFEELPENLKEIADLRVEHPDISLIELGKMLKEPVGKSGVNYRLKKIVEIAEELS